MKKKKKKSWTEIQEGFYILEPKQHILFVPVINVE